MKTLIESTELTEEEQYEFAEHFYLYSCLDAEEDCKTSCPWGCPWLFGSKVILEGASIEEMAKNFAKKVEPEILELLKEEQEFNDREFGDEE